MKYLKEFWFWFGLIICPILIMFSVFGVGQMLGKFAYSQNFVFEGMGQILIVSLGICAAFEFARALKSAKVRFNQKRI